MVPDADLHLTGCNLEIRFAHRWNGTRCEPDPNAPAVIERFLSCCDYLVQRSAQSSLGSAYFPHQHFSGDTATFLPLGLRGGGHIVIGDHRLNLDSFELGQLSGHFYVQIVSGIITIETGHPLATVGAFERI